MALGFKEVSVSGILTQMMVPLVTTGYQSAIRTLTNITLLSTGSKLFSTGRYLTMVSASLVNGLQEKVFLVLMENVHPLSKPINCSSY
jgi:hypothetical protein